MPTDGCCDAQCPRCWTPARQAQVREARILAAMTFAQRKAYRIAKQRPRTPEPK